jgi:hypothetical protein
MDELNDLATVLDTEGTNRKDMVANLINDYVGVPTLFADRGVPGAELSSARVIDSETVKLNFYDGRNITIRIEIDPPTS